MNNIFLILIIVIIILIIIKPNIFTENFSVDSNCNEEYIYRNEISKLDNNKNYMIRDIKTQYLLIIDNGVGKFAPGNFGVPLVLTPNAKEYLPFRLANDPNYYLLSNYNGDGIRAVSNPYTDFFKFEILIYKERNIIGYYNEANTQYYLFIDDAGFISSTTNPDKASIIEMLFVE
jgi:hypothetical protein